MKVKFELDLTEVQTRELLNVVMGFASDRTVGADLASGKDFTGYTTTQVMPVYEVTPPVATPAPTPAVVYAPPVITPPVITSAPPVVPVHQVVTEYVAPAPNPSIVPTLTPETYTLEQLAVAASTQLVDTGRRNELIELLGQFGITTMAQLPQDKYTAFAGHLRAKGVKI